MYIGMAFESSLRVTVGCLTRESTGSKMVLTSQTVKVKNYFALLPKFQNFLSCPRMNADESDDKIPELFLIQQYVWSQNSTDKGSDAF